MTSLVLPDDLEATPATGSATAARLSVGSVSAYSIAAALEYSERRASASPGPAGDDGDSDSDISIR